MKVKEKEKLQASTQESAKVIVKEEVQKSAQKKAQECVAEPAHHIELGKRGEQAAARYLERRGFEILERNWTCLAGEADIIAHDDESLVFIEVKTRSNGEHGLPEEAVDKEKRRRYEGIAASFLADYKGTDIAVRFDVISILVLSEDRALLRHHSNAFSCGE